MCEFVLVEVNRGKFCLNGPGLWSIGLNWNELGRIGLNRTELG